MSTSTERGTKSVKSPPASAAAINQTIGASNLLWVDPHELRPNTWNPNVMSQEMFMAAIESIRAHGFVQPIVARWILNGLEIIDGEHRAKAAIQEDLPLVPVFNLGTVDDDTARELTVVLNETHGDVRQDKLEEILRDLLKRRSAAILLKTMPYNRGVLMTLTGTMPALGEPPSAKRTVEGWVERTYRMPAEAAEVLDNAIAKVREGEGDLPEWRCLELVAADFLA